MPVMMEPHAPLGRYAIRATFQHKLVVEELDGSNRARIVHSDIGPQAVPLSYRADGIVIFDFPAAATYAGGEISGYELPETGAIPPTVQAAQEARVEIRERRYRYMNAFLTYFNSSFTSSNELDPPCNQNRYINVIGGGAQPSLMDNSNYRLQELPYMSAISIDSLITAAASFRSLDGDIIDMGLDLSDLYYRCCYHKSNHEYSTCLVLAWAIVERCQNYLWSTYIQGGYKTVAPHAEITGQRRKTLLGDRNYTAAIKTQILAFGNVYSDQEVEWLDKTRKNRNDYMHSLRPVGSIEAFGAQLAAARLMYKVCGVEPRPFGSISSWDYIR